MITLPLAIKYLTNDAYQREVDGEYDAIHFDECLSVVVEAASHADADRDEMFKVLAENVQLMSENKKLKDKSK